MYGLVKNNKIIATGNEFISGKDCETVKISNNLNYLDKKIINYKPIIKTFKDFKKEIELKKREENKKIKDKNLILENGISDYEINKKFNKYLDTFKENDFNLIETEEYLEKQKAEKLLKIIKRAENRIKNEVYIRKNRNGIKEFYSDWEIKTWSTKVEEAKKAIGGLESILLNMYKPVGITLLEYAQKILKKAKEKSVITADIEKEKNEAINALYK